MEYRINKIDTDLRQRINDITKEGKVHGTKSISINKDAQEQKKKNKEFKKYLSQQRNKDKLLVEAVKSENVEVEAYKEGSDAEDSAKGVFLDTKK